MNDKIRMGRESFALGLAITVGFSGFDVDIKKIGKIP
jgi:hypothetical protein